MEKIILLTILAFSLLLGGCSLTKNITNQQENTNQQPSDETQNDVLGNEDVNNEPVASESDEATKDWQTYKNEEYRYEVRYPKDWEAELSDKILYISYPGFREGEPEGGGSIKIEVREISLRGFIDEYNNSSPTLEDGTRLSEIVETGDYLLDGVSATKLVASTGIGLDIDYIFAIKDNESYIIAYYSFDTVHNDILSTFKFTK